MTLVDQPPAVSDAGHRQAATRRRILATLAAPALIAVGVGLHLLAARFPRVAGAEVSFVSLFAESLPFLLVGAVLSAALHGRWASRALRAAIRHPRGAVLVAPFAGLVLPLCDCGLLPLARRLRDEGGRRPVTAFLAGAPLANPIVIVSTLLAFPGRPQVAIARAGCGIVVALLAAGLAPQPGKNDEADGQEHTHDHGPLALVGAELTRTGPILAVGALLAASAKAALPTSTFTTLASQPLLGALAMMALAFLMSICSQADAFVAAALPVGPLPRLAFLVLGPALDLRLAVLYRREFGTRWVLGYAAVVVPAALLTATVAATLGLA